jgi:hypothetical protein
MGHSASIESMTGALSSGLFVTNPRYHIAARASRERRLTPVF